jgi:hypothetical protein
MIPLTLTFDIPAKILSGLADGSLIRNGGVIQDTSGQVVMWLRELGETGLVPNPSSLMLPSLDLSDKVLAPPGAAKLCHGWPPVLVLL